jgi:hypothetical protein
MIPMIAGTLLVPEAAIPAAAARLTALGVSEATALKAASTLPASTVGAMMGVGGQKGQDYETVKRELLAKKVPEAEAERLAQKAAEYSLENAPRQLNKQLWIVLNGFPPLAYIGVNSRLTK